MENRIVLQGRRQLDDRFAALPSAEWFAAPTRGWIKAIREALGMSSEQLAKRLGVKQPTVAAIERSETRGTIELATLRRAAEALDCTLVYALASDLSARKRAAPSSWRRCGAPPKRSTARSSMRWC